MSSSWSRDRPSRRSLTALGIVSLLAVGPAMSALAESSSPSEPDLERAAEARAPYGLPIDTPTLERLLTDGSDVGTDRWGIPMTTEEDATVDLAGRMSYVQDLEVEVLPYVRSLPAFAGVWVDQLRDGGVVVMLTRRDTEVETTLEGMLPASSRGLWFSYVQHTEQELIDAARLAVVTWAEVDAAVEPIGVAVDTRDNEVEYRFLATDIAGAEAYLDDMRSHLGVSVSFVAEEAGSDTACQARDNCHDPFRAGQFVRRANQTGFRCTMGFHIEINGTNDQFLTAGHCGYSGSDDWYANNYGLIGDERATLYAPNGIDIMRVKVDDADQMSDRIYMRDAWPIVGPVLPIQGETLCASLAATGTILTCSTVTDNYHHGTARPRILTILCGAVT